MLKAGDTFGNFTLVSELGRGANGEVWLAERRSALLSTLVALKFPLNSAISQDSLRLEAKVWQQASGHPNVVPVLEAEIYNHQVVIASEYVAGGSLAQWLHNNDAHIPSLNDTVRIICDVLAGLEFLHNNSIIHRDLKPDNVLLQAGIARLTDFGLARVRQSGRITSGAGTPGYMAPEAFDGTYSPMTDIWAVGCILYEMLVRTLPFPSTDIIQAYQSVLNDDPPQLPQSIPQHLREATMRALSRAPEARFQTASAMHEAIVQPAPHLHSVRQVMDHTPVIPSDTSGVAKVPTQGNLPIQSNSFIGRTAEVTNLVNTVSKRRIVTVTGPGGCGKTRLALRVAEEVQDQFPDGVWFVELAPISEPTLLPHVVARLLGVGDGQQSNEMEDLVKALKSRIALIILDNCEHLTGACAEFVDRVIRGCATIQFVVTSRSRLSIAGEQVFSVPSLSLPKSGNVPSQDRLACEAVQLFVERAEYHAPDFDVNNCDLDHIVQICRQLDGIPLAIELAAARVRSLSIDQIAKRLDDRFRLLTGGNRTALPRQQTLRALIDWSYDLLTTEERIVLEFLSVFQNGCSLEAIESVCLIPSVTPLDVMDKLQSLVDQSLVQHALLGGRSRYRLTETMKEYGVARLLERGLLDIVRDSHRDYFMEYAKEAEPEVQKSDKRTLDLLESEHDNLRAALERSHCGEDRLRCAVYLHRFWLLHGHLNEGRKWFERSLQTESAISDEWRARGHNSAGILAWSQGDLAAARRHFDQSLVLFRHINENQYIPRILANLGMVASMAEEYENAAKYFEESLRYFREQNDVARTSQMLSNLGGIYIETGQPRQARALLIESLTINRSLNDVGSQAIILYNLALAATLSGREGAARRLFLKCLATRSGLGDRRGMALTLFGLALCFVHTLNATLALKTIVVAERLQAEIGLILSNADQNRYSEVLDFIEGTMKSDAIKLIRTNAHSLGVNDLVALIRASL